MTSAPKASTGSDTPAQAAGAGSGPTIAIQPLTKYVLPDKTASVMLPDGWRVTQTGVAFIRAEGPKGELAMFGVTVPAHDAPAGGGASPPAPLSQPYSADAGDKLNQSIQWVRTANGQSPVQVTKVYSNNSFDAPAEFGACSKITATLGVQRGGVLDAEADIQLLCLSSDRNARLSPYCGSRTKDSHRRRSPERRGWDLSLAMEIP